MIYLLYMILKYNFFNIFGCWNFCVSQSRNSACVEKNLYFVVFLYILYFVVQKFIFKFWCITILKWITYRNVGDWKYSTKTAEKMILPVFLSLHQTFEMRACFFFIFNVIRKKVNLYCNTVNTVSKKLCTEISQLRIFNQNDMKINFQIF